MMPDYIASQSDRTAKIGPPDEKVPFRPCLWERGEDVIMIKFIFLPDAAKLWVFSDFLLYRGSYSKAGVCACREEMEKSKR